jgi:hypothetical protein
LATLMSHPRTAPLSSRDATLMPLLSTLKLTLVDAPLATVVAGKLRQTEPRHNRTVASVKSTRGKRRQPRQPAYPGTSSFKEMEANERSAPAACEHARPSAQNHSAKQSRKPFLPQRHVKQRRFGDLSSGDTRLQDTNNTVSEGTTQTTSSTPARNNNGSENHEQQAGRPGKAKQPMAVYRLPTNKHATDNVTRANHTQPPIQTKELGIQNLTADLVTRVRSEPNMAQGG